MARILLSAIVTEIRGKIGGTVFQSGQGGFQAKRLAVPRDISNGPQLQRRNAFHATTIGWQGLTSFQRSSWDGGPDPGLSGYTTYVRKNCIMRFFGQSPFTSPPGSSSVNPIDLTATTISSSAFILIGVAPLNNLPSGFMMAIMATRQNSAGKGAYSPSEFVMVKQFTGPIDFASSHQNITTDYTNKFGTLLTGRALQFRCLIVDLATGSTSLSAQGQFIIT